MASSPLLDLPTMGADLERIEVALREAVRTSDDYLTEMATHLIAAGGKRLRPVMAVTAALTGHPEADDDVVRGGVSVELVHIGSLYHDDVMDEAEMRRAVPSVNARWGNHRAILSGDFLLARASEIAASLGAEVAGLLGHTIGRLVEGQISELRTQYDPTRPEDEYFRSIEGKTASLFASAARIGGIVAGLPRTHIDALTEFGRSFGMVFQIVDDILDLTATEAQLGKPAGHDMVEGVYTLPVLRTIAAGGGAAAELVDLLGAPLEGAALDKALALVRTGNGLTEARAAARRYADRCAASVMGLDASPATAALARAGYALVDSVG